jgi:molecular chaperone HscB
MPAPNYFDIFGLPQKLNLDVKDLESRFYELSKQSHPDRFAAAGQMQKRAAESDSANLNGAYKTLRDPVLRAEYLLKLRGLEVAGQKQIPPELLDEVFELNSALEDEIDSSRGPLEEFQAKFLKMNQDLDRDLEAEFSAWDEFGNQATLDKMRGILNKRKYISNLILKVQKALA